MNIRVGCMVRDDRCRDGGCGIRGDVSLNGSVLSGIDVGRQQQRKQRLQTNTLPPLGFDVVVALWVDVSNSAIDVLSFSLWILDGTCDLIVMSDRGWAC